MVRSGFIQSGKYLFAIKGKPPFYTEPQNRDECLDFAYKYAYIAQKDIEKGLIKDAEEHLNKSIDYLKSWKRRRK